MPTTVVRIAPLLLLTVVCGCEFRGAFTDTQYGPELREPVTVENTVFTPAVHGSTDGVGFSMSGDISFHGGSINTQPEWATVLSCPHGQFVVKGEETWKRVAKGRKYTCVYREVFEMRLYRLASGRDSVVSRSLIDYDFLRLEDVK